MNDTLLSLNLSSGEPLMGLKQGGTEACHLVVGKKERPVLENQPVNRTQGGVRRGNRQPEHSAGGEIKERRYEKKRETSTEPQLLIH